MKKCSLRHCCLLFLLMTACCCLICIQLLAGARETSTSSTQIEKEKPPDFLQYRLKNHPDVQNYPGRLLSYANPAPGVQYQQVLQQTARGPIHINIIEANPASPSLSIEPVLADNRLGARATVRQLVQRHQALAGINASFFKQDVGIPLGTLIMGQELVSGPLFQRVCFGLTQQGKANMAKLTLHGSVFPVFPKTALKTVFSVDKLKVSIHNINQPRVSIAQTVLYTDKWGPKAPLVPSSGVQIQVKDGRLARVSYTEPLDIPAGSFVVSGPISSRLGQDALAVLAQLSLGTEIASSFYTLPDWSNMRNAISGGPYLVHQGNVYIDLKSQQFHQGLGAYEPRSAVGIKANGNILMVTVDGRQQQSVGLSLTELAMLMRELGAEEAMNLDGGSSTQMVVGSKLVNVPTVVNGARVSTALLIKQTEPVFSLSKYTPPESIAKLPLPGSNQVRESATQAF